MYHHIIQDDLPETHWLEPYRDERGRLRGFTLGLARDAWETFLSLRAPFRDDVLCHLNLQWGVQLHRLPAVSKRGTRFGFTRRIELVELGETVILRILFGKERRRALSTALNLQWLLEAIRGDKGNHTDRPKEKLQLLYIDTSIAHAPTVHGCYIHVTVGRVCAALLDTFPANTDLPEVRKTMNDMWRCFGFRYHPWLQAHVREKGILHFSSGGDCNCLGQNPDERILPYGYDMHSHNTDEPIHQIALLIGLAETWRMLRKMRDAS